METQPQPSVTTTVLQARALRTRNMLIVAHAFQHILSMALPTLLLFIRPDLGYSFTQIGIIAAAANVTGGLIQFPAGLLADRFGSKQLLVIGYVFTLGGLALLSTSGTFWMMILSQVIVGIGNATFHPASFPAVANATRQTGLGMGMALHNIGGISGGAISYTLVPVLASTVFGWRGALRIMVGVAAVLAVYFAFAYQEPERERVEQDASPHRAKEDASERRIRRRETLHDWMPVIVIALAAFLSGAFGQGLMTFLPTFLNTTKGSSEIIAGMLSTLMMVAGAFGSFFGGKLADRYDRTSIILFAVAVTAALIMVMANAALGAIGLGVIIAAVGFGRSMTRPPFHAITSEVSPSGRSGSVFGLVFGGSFLGGSIGNPLVGFVADHVSMQWAFAVIAGLFLAHGLIVRGMHTWRGARVENVSASSRTT